MNYKWDFHFLTAFIPALIKGLGVTLYVSLLSIIVGTIIGIAVAVGRRSQVLPLRIFSSIYINLFLAFPVLVLLIWLYYCLPVLAGISISSTTTTIVALSLSLGGFIGDIVRGGIDSIPRGQAEAALTLGLSRWQTMRRIVLPQAVRIMVPPILGQYITCVKLSSLASVIAVYELLHTANNIISQTYKPLETYTAVAILYLLMIWPLVRLMRFFEIRTLSAFNIGYRSTTLKDYFIWFRNA